MHGVEDGGEGVAEFVREHRQELVLAAVQVGQRRRLLLRLPLQAAAFGDVPDVALDDLVVVLLVDVADELDFDLAARSWLSAAGARSGCSPSLAVPGRRPGSPRSSRNRPISHSSLPRNSSCA